MSAMEDAIKRVVQNVLQNAIEKYVGPNLPQYIETMKATVEKVNGFDEKLNYIASQLQEIRHAQNLSANGGPSMAEMIEFGHPSINMETSDGAQVSYPIDPTDISSLRTRSDPDLSYFMHKFKELEHGGSNDSGNPGTTASGAGNLRDVGN